MTEVDVRWRRRELTGGYLYRPVSERAREAFESFISSIEDSRSYSFGKRYDPDEMKKVNLMAELVFAPEE